MIVGTQPTASRSTLHDAIIYLLYMSVTNFDGTLCRYIPGRELACIISPHVTLQHLTTASHKNICPVR